VYRPLFLAVYDDTLLYRFGIMTIPFFIVLAVYDDTVIVLAVYDNLLSRFGNICLASSEDAERT
jgi:hypothetical protein